MRNGCPDRSIGFGSNREGLQIATRKGATHKGRWSHRIRAGGNESTEPKSETHPFNALRRLGKTTANST